MRYMNAGNTGTDPAPAPVRRPASWRVWRAVVVTVLALALVIGAGLGLSACSVELGETATSTSSAATTSTEVTGATGATATIEGSGSVLAGADGLMSPAQAVGAKLGPSVVNIKVKGTVSDGMFGQQSFGGEASGIIYTSNGMIVTNNHVVTDEYYGEEVNEITVTLATGETLGATIVGRDPLTDLAVIKVVSDMPLPAATFSSDQPTVGEYAVAIGSPQGFENSVTLGIVSGVDRSMEDYASGTEAVALNNLIQTDAAISQGNSGGALANASGQVIGINVAGVFGQGAENLGFAIPSVVVTKIADEIISTGKATHAYLGVQTQAVTSELEQTFRLSRSSGILVGAVTAGGPAGKAGVQQGDIIIKLDDQEMVQSSDVLVAIRDKMPGDTVELTIDRGGTVTVIKVVLEERPANL